MASVVGFPNDAPRPTNAEAVFTPPTLWWCTSNQEPCLPLKFMTIDPTYIKTDILSLLIPPPHNFLKNLDCLTQNLRNIVNFQSYLLG